MGTLVVWDDWFSGHGAHLSRAQLRADPHLRPRWEGALPRDPRHPEHDTTRLAVFERVR
ncbi:hypothetical protein ACFQ48_17460 [Hymenobacter caeli]|uniref:Uncharacterized protein n=1 Tax=Hymenobacter caeli TaxID=2735894 RepID=A0ABX2FUR5_9BACT|nr:hypothetical protein [Hymenobacter caeli]NRT20864.1 hypothetical protein [Hymenobacter caeli]